jgi:poly-gamma-glutamate synthesis protein (capsule biosynthesis protein)
MSRLSSSGRSLLTAAGAGLVALTLLAAPGSASRDTRAPGGPGPSGSTWTVAARTGAAHGTPPASGSPASGPITLAFGGDVHFEAQLAPLLRHPDDALTSLRPYLSMADVAMVNLETAITNRGTPQPKEFHFRTSPAALRTVAAAGVDVVTMANNHAVDFGRTGLADTLAARRASPIPVVGIGASAADAYAPAILRVRDRRVAVLGASQLMDWTLQHFAATPGGAGIAGARPLEPLLTAVRAARRQADVVVVYLHWGVERQDCPEAAQRDAARQLAAAGADVIVGAHPHVTQGGGWLGSAYVAYSLGNFVWYNPSSEATSSTGVLTLTLDGRRVRTARWTPLRIRADGVPRPPGAATAALMTNAWQRSRACTHLADQPG